MLRESLETLEEANAAAQELERKTVAARRTLAGYLFWIPTPPSARTLSEIDALARMDVVARELARGRRHRRRRTGAPAFLALVGVAGGGHAAGGLRGRLRRWLVAFSPEVVTWDRFQIRDAVAAFGITFALAVPVPLVLWTGAALLSTAPTDQGFVLSLSGALRMVAALLLGLSSLAWLIHPDGLAIRYFGRSAASLDAAARTLRRFMALFVFLFAIAALNMVEHAPNTNRESLGRLALGFVLLGSVVFLARHLRRGGPLVQRLVANAPGSWGVRLHPSGTVHWSRCRWPASSSPLRATPSPRPSSGRESSKHCFWRWVLRCSTGWSGCG